MRIRSHWFEMSCLVLFVGGLSIPATAFAPCPPPSRDYLHLKAEQMEIDGEIVPAGDFKYGNLYGEDDGAGLRIGIEDAQLRVSLWTSPQAGE